MISIRHGVNSTVASQRALQCGREQNKIREKGDPTTEDVGNNKQENRAEQRGALGDRNVPMSTS